MSPSPFGDYFFNEWCIPYFVAFFINFIIAWLLFFKARKDERVQLYILTEFFVAILCFSVALATCSLDKDTWLFWMVINRVTSLLAVATLFHFSYVFLYRIKIFEDLLVFLVYLVPLFYISVFLIDIDQLYPSVLESDGSPFGLFEADIERFSPPFLWGFFDIFLVVMLILAAVNFFRMFRLEDVEIRRRSAYFILASLIPLIFITMEDFLEVIFPDFNLKLDLGIVSLSITGVIISIGILKHKLFDIDLILPKSFYYITTVLVLVWVFILSGEVLVRFITGGEESIFSRFAAVLLTLILFFPVREMAGGLASRLFPRDFISRRRKTGLPSGTALEIYRKQLQLAWSGGEITEKEGRLLKDLRLSLGISNREHERLEKELIGALEIYRKQLQLAWEGGEISEKERMMLKDLRLSLGISDKEHERLEKEIIDANVQ